MAYVQYLMSLYFSSDAPTDFQLHVVQSFQLHVVHAAESPFSAVCDESEHEADLRQ